MKKPLNVLIAHEKRIRAENGGVQREQAYHARLLDLKALYDEKLQRQNVRHCAKVACLEQAHFEALAKVQAQNSVGSLRDDVEAKRRYVVANWRSGWKWISNWALAGIAYIATYGVPQEVVDALPATTQAKVIVALSVIGFVGRFLNQTKPRLPPVVQV